MRKLSFGVALLFLLQLGISAPKSSVDPKQSSADPKGAKKKKSYSSVSTPQALGDEIVKFFGSKTGKELMAEKSGNVAGVGSAATQVLAEKSSVQSEKTTPEKPSVQGAKIASVKPGYVPPPPTPRASVPQIRQEIQKIFDLNKKIKSVQGGRSAQLQRVQEQARIHQKILNELEASQKQTSGQKASPSALLAQEKLRIIHEETQRNTQVVNDLKAVSSKPVAKPVANVRPAVKVKPLAS